MASLALALALLSLVLLYSYRPGMGVSGKGYSKRWMSVSRAKGVPTMLAEGECSVSLARPGIGIEVDIEGYEEEG